MHEIRTITDTNVYGSRLAIATRLARASVTLRRIVRIGDRLDAHPITADPSGHCTTPTWSSLSSGIR
jgi:hypothetical protein